MSRPLTKPLPHPIFPPLLPPRPHRRPHILIPLRQILPIRPPRVFKQTMRSVGQGVGGEGGVPDERRGGGEGAVGVGCVEEGGDEEGGGGPCG